MLVITYDSGKDVEWHIGEKMPVPCDILGFVQGAVGMLDEVNVRHITQLQADGDELEHIKKLFTNELHAGTPPYSKETFTGPSYFSIPMPNARVCRWADSIARTIYVNLYDWKIEQSS